MAPISIPLGQSRSGPVGLSLEVYHNAGATKSPLAIITPGFLLESSLYRSYARALAAHGWTAVLWDVSEVSDDATTVNHLRSIIDFACMDPRLARLADTSRTYLIGHSRGGKLSCLAAARDERVRGLCLLDPVDNTPMTPSGPGYPSCLPGLRAISNRQRSPVPVAVVGAALNQDVIPSQGNYKRFVGVCDGPLWEVDLKGAGHLQFLDRQVPLLTALSAAGPTPDATVRDITRDVILAWGERVVRPARQLETPEQLQSFFQSEGTALSSLAPLSASIRNLHRFSPGTPALTPRPSAPPPTPTPGAGRTSTSPPPPPPPPRTSPSPESEIPSSFSWPSWATATSPTPPPPSPPQPSNGGTPGRKKATWSRSWAGVAVDADASWEARAGAAVDDSSSPAASAAAGGSTAAAGADGVGVGGRGSASGGGSTSTSSSGVSGTSGSAASGSGGAAGEGAGGPGPVTETYEELMGRRAKEVKAMLVERGIDSSDCFEKADLVRRLLERAGGGK